MMEGYGNQELDDRNQNDWNEYNKTGLDEEGGNKSTDNSNEDMIHSDKKET